MEEAVAKETKTDGRKVQLIKMSVERAASAIAYIVQHSTDVDFCTYFQTRLQMSNNHGIHCRTSEVLWGTCEMLFDINVFQCTCKYRLKHRGDLGDGISSSASSPQEKLCSLKTASCTDFFQQVQAVPDLHSSCDWFEDVLKEE